MLKPPHPAAVVGYLTAMLVNPNNHALDGGPATARMEKEAVAQLAAMFGLATHLGHLTTSGTIANLEALYVARELHPGRGIAYSAEAHYTHARMCGVLGVEGTPVAVDDAGRLDPRALDALLARGTVGTVVATAGTTGLGAIDPVHEVLAVARSPRGPGPRRRRVRRFLHPAGGRARPGRAGRGAVAGHRRVRLGGGRPAQARAAALRVRGRAVPRTRMSAASTCMTPPTRISPPTSCTSARSASSAPGPGRRRPRCGSRSGCCRRTPDGLGRVLAAGRRAALEWAQLISGSGRLELYQPPELDIVSYFPATRPRTLAAIDRASARMLAGGMADPARPVFLSTLRITAADFARRHPGVEPDREGARILRSVLMKPEAESYLPELHARVERLAGG